MIWSRRKLVGGLLAGAAAWRPTFVNAEAGLGAPEVEQLSDEDRSLFHSIENLPWIGSQGNSEFPVYVLYAPWCPFCKQLAQDVAAGKLGTDIQLRWIGCAPNSPVDAQRIAQTVMSRDFDVIRSGFQGSPLSNTVPDAYVERAIASSLAYYVITKKQSGLGGSTGFPLVVYVRQNQVIVQAGYGGLATAAKWQPSRRASKTFTPATFQLLSEDWGEAGRVAGGQFYDEKRDTPRFSLPSELSVPYPALKADFVVAASRYLLVRNKRWLEMPKVVGLGSYRYNVYAHAAS